MLKFYFCGKKYRAKKWRNPKVSMGYREKIYAESKWSFGFGIKIDRHPMAVIIKFGRDMPKTKDRFPVAVYGS